MNKDEILNASRMENNNKDFAEIEIENKAVKIASLGILILTSIYFCLEIFVKGETNYGWYSILGLYCGIVYGYKGIKTGKKLNLITAAIWISVTVGFIYFYIKNIFLTSNIL